MSTRTSRNSKRTVAALAAFGVIASTFAIGSPASANLFDGVGTGGIRLVPDDTPDPVFGDQGNQDQPAPVVQAGIDGQAAASSQLMIHNQWVSGDRVLVQLFDSAQLNCTSVPTSIGYGAAPTVTVAGAFGFDAALNSPWGPNEIVPGLPEAGPITQDAPVDVAGLTAPTFNVELLSSTGCSANGITDVLAIEFNNASSGAPSTDAWVLTIDGVVLNIGSAVTAGPVNQVPFGQNATAAAPGYVNTLTLFSANQSALQSGVALDINEWTNPAFVAPITLTSTDVGAFVADGFAQDLGTVTLSETQGGAFTTGFYGICFGPGITNINEDLLTVTGSTGVTVPATSVSVYSSSDFENCIQFEITAATAAVSSITIEGIFGDVDTAGAKFVSLDFVPDTFTTAYLTPDDQTQGVGNYTDVNMGELDVFVTPLGTAASQPDRIGGADRYETAAKIALSFTCNDVAVIASGTSYPDALSATYLAGALAKVFPGEVPILLSEAGTLPDSTIVALRETGVRSVYIIGGTNAISQQVEDELAGSRRYYCGGDASFSDQNLVVNRIGGATRYDTNNDVIERVQTILAGQFNDDLRYQATSGESSKRTALVATGENFADALIGGQFAYGAYGSLEHNYRFPLILTTGGTVSPQALQSMVSVDIEQAVILGGETAVSAEVEAAIEAAGVDVIRLAGADRYETAAAVNNWALAGEFPGTPAVVAADLPYDLGLGQIPTGAYFFTEDGPVLRGEAQAFVARGDDFADALASAPWVSNAGGLLTLSDRAVLSPATQAWLESVDPLFNRVTAFGLGAAITTSVLNAANAAVN